MKTRFSLKFLLVLIGLLAIGLAYINNLNNRAEKEHTSYEELRKFGVYYDDWVNTQELLTGKTEIQHLYVPKEAPTEIVFEHLPNFVNLQSLSIEWDELKRSQIQILQNLNLYRLEFSGAFPTDEDLALVSKLVGLQFLSLRGDLLSDESKRQLSLRLPNAKIEYR